MTTVAESIYGEELYQIEYPAVIVVTKPWAEIATTEKEQLQKICDALSKRINPKLKLDAFQIVQQTKLELGAIHPAPKRVIYFGQAVSGLNNYESIEVNGTKVVLSASLDELIKDEPARQKLWKALQQLFA